eukprot:scaffold407552_cov31-Prasinocladus_malaysianus.AAC.1
MHGRQSSRSDQTFCLMVGQIEQRADCLVDLLKIVATTRNEFCERGEALSGHERVSSEVRLAHGTANGPRYDGLLGRSRRAFLQDVQQRLDQRPSGRAVQTRGDVRDDLAEDGSDGQP